MAAWPGGAQSFKGKRRLGNVPWNQCCPSLCVPPFVSGQPPGTCMTARVIMLGCAWMQAEQEMEMRAKIRWDDVGVAHSNKMFSPGKPMTVRREPTEPALPPPPPPSSANAKALQLLGLVSVGKPRSVVSAATAAQPAHLNPLLALRSGGPGTAPNLAAVTQAFNRRRRSLRDGKFGSTPSPSRQMQATVPRHLSPPQSPTKAPVALQDASPPRSPGSLV